MFKLDQKGIALIEGLLIAIIIILIGFVGFYVWNAKQDTDKNLNINAVTETTKNKKTSPTNDLAIKEWGVKISLSSNTGNAYYSQNSVHNDNPPIFLDVFSEKADAITGPKGVSCKGEYIALLMRLPKDDPLWNDAQYVGASSAQKTIGEYKYNLAIKKQYGPECFDKGAAGDYQVDETTSSSFSNVVDSFVKDFDSLSAI